MFGGKKGGYIKITEKEMKKLKKQMSPKAYKELERRIKKENRLREDELIEWAVIMGDEDW